jgi:hypothetical protein
MRKWQKYNLKRAKLMFLKEPQGSSAFAFFNVGRKCEMREFCFKILHRKNERN